MKSRVRINRRSMVMELTASDPILKRVADEVLREAFFEPAVQAMQEEFASHPVTEEIRGGVDADNISETLDARFREDLGEGDTKANLWGFIGFDAAATSPAEALAPIMTRLDPRHPDGPKMTYESRDREKLTYRYVIRGPNETAIWKETDMPWMEGISWVKRVEQGISGVGHYLNVANRPGSRSGGGVQVDAQLRGGRFKATSYLSAIVNNFLRRVAGRGTNGRAL